MTWEKLLNIKLTSQGALPKRVRSKDIATIISSFEEIVSLIALETNSSIKIDKDSIILGLSAVGSGSYEFETNAPELCSNAFSTVANAFHSQNLFSLSSPVRDELKQIVDVVKTRGFCLLFNSLTVNNASSFLLSPETKIPEITLIRGETVLYGIATRAGGKKPKIQFQPIQNRKKLVLADTSREIAVEVGKRLYQEVALEGIAEWNPEDGEVEKFEAKRLLDYQETKPLEAFKILRDKYGDIFSDIDDVDEFISTFRE